MCCIDLNFKLAHLNLTLGSCFISAGRVFSPSTPLHREQIDLSDSTTAVSAALELSALRFNYSKATVNNVYIESSF